MMKNSKITKIKKLRKKALNYFDKEKWNESAKIYKKILEVYPDDSEALVTGGGALSNAGKHREALKFLNKALKIDPEDLSALENKGITLSKLKKPKLKEALKCLDKVLKSVPNRKHTIRNKIDILYDMGKFDENFYRKALKLRCISKLDYYHDKGLQLELKNNFKGAIKYFKKAHKLYPKNIHILDHLAVDFFNIKNYSESLHYSNKLLRLKPKDIESLRLKTKTLLKLKKYDESVVFLNKLIRFDKKSSKNHLKLRNIILKKRKWKIT